MYAKCAITMIAAVAIGLGVLELRHQRLQIMHDMAQLHTQMDRVRRETWDLQVRVADGSAPGMVRSAAERQQLALEPQVVRDLSTDVAIVQADPQEPRR